LEEIAEEISQVSDAVADIAEIDALAESITDRLTQMVGILSRSSSSPSSFRISDIESPSFLPS
jgi:hypothetical protein